MIFHIFKVLLIFQFESTICQNFFPNNQPKLLSPCSRHDSGGIYPHYSNCSLFIECDNTHEVIKSCGLGTAFDRRFNICNHYENVPECFDGSTNIIMLTPLPIPNQPPQDPNQIWQSTNNNNQNSVSQQNTLSSNPNYLSTNYANPSKGDKLMYPVDQAEYQPMNNLVPQLPENHGFEFQSRPFEPKPFPLSIGNNMLTNKPPPSWNNPKEFDWYEYQQNPQYYFVPASNDKKDVQTNYQNTNPNGNNQLYNANYLTNSNHKNQMSDNRGDIDDEYSDIDPRVHP